MALTTTSRLTFSCRKKKFVTEAIRANLLEELAEVRRAVSSCGDLLTSVASGCLGDGLRIPELTEDFNAVRPRLPQLLQARDLSSLAASMTAAHLQKTPDDALAKSLLAALKRKLWKFAPGALPAQWLRKNDLNLSAARMKAFLEKRHDYSIEEKSGSRCDVSFLLESVICIRSTHHPQIDVFAYDKNDYLPHMARLLKAKGSYADAFILRSREDFNLAKSSLSAGDLTTFEDFLTAKDFKLCKEEGKVLRGEEVQYTEGLLLISHCIGFDKIHFIGNSIHDLAAFLSPMANTEEKLARLRGISLAFSWHQRLLSYFHFLEMEPCGKKGTAKQGLGQQLAIEFGNTEAYAQTFRASIEVEMRKLICRLDARTKDSRKAALFLPKEKAERYLKVLELLLLEPSPEKESRAMSSEPGKACAFEAAALKPIYDSEFGLGVNAQLEPLPESLREFFRYEHRC